MTTNYEIIRNAILNKEQIIAYYNGYPREMCPHVIGQTNGHEQALFYQFGGGSEKGLDVPGSSKNWRCIEIAKLSEVSTRKGQWHTASNYSQNQKCVKEIDVKVAP
jgi:hypothetical protein